MAFAAPAQAGVIYQSAAYSGDDFGDYILSKDDFIGAAFQLTSTTKITGIGAQFGANNGGTIFGAIVHFTDLTSLPSVASSHLADITVADVVFTVPNGTTALDLIEPLNTTLGAGAYGLVFGAGLFGSDASGFAGLGGYNTPIGSSDLFRSFYSDDWTGFDDNVRLVVEGSAVSAVPLPAPLALFSVSVGLLGLVGGYRRQGSATSAMS